MKYLILGTAGHVDHGKTALIRLLPELILIDLKEKKQENLK